MLAGKPEMCQMGKGRMLLFVIRMGNNECNNELFLFCVA